MSYASSLGNAQSPPMGQFVPPIAQINQPAGNLFAQGANVPQQAQGIQIISKPINATRILLLSGFAPELKTRDLLAVFTEWEDQNGGFRIKWIDDRSAYIVFQDPIIAKKAFLATICNMPASLTGETANPPLPAAKLSPYIGPETETILATTANRPRSRSNATGSIGSLSQMQAFMQNGLPTSSSSGSISGASGPPGGSNGGRANGGGGGSHSRRSSLASYEIAPLGGALSGHVRRESLGRINGGGGVRFTNGPPPSVPNHQHTGSESSTHSTSSATAANDASTTTKPDGQTATGLEQQVEALKV